MKLAITLAVFLFSHPAHANVCVPLNTSILMFDEGDVLQCSEHIAQAKGLGNRRVNLLFTTRFLLDNDQNITTYCFPTVSGKCEPVTEALLSRMKGHWAKCLKAAADHDLDISIYLQMDDAGPSNLWRNNLKFDPLEKHAGYSYDDVLPGPIARIANEQTKPGNRIEFSLQGEMGATLASHPRSHIEMIRLTKERLSPRTNIQVGVNVNYTSVLGFGAKLTDVMVPEVQALLYATDFVGISTYHEVMIPIDAEDFRFSYDMAQAELKKLGVAMPNGKQTRISEIGMGGGRIIDDGNKPAATIEELAAALWSGVRGIYDRARDPFQRVDFRNFRRDYYRQLLKFLKQPPPDLNLKSAYLWNADSWDVQGFYPDTVGYRDDAVVDAIRQHNAGCK